MPTLEEQHGQVLYKVLGFLGIFNHGLLINYGTL